MAEIPNNIKIILKNYLDELNKLDFCIEKAILFGSYAKDEHNELSDIDIALISSKFSGSRFEDRILLSEPTVKINSSISPIPFRPEDFNASDYFVNEIIKTGIRIV